MKVAFTAWEDRISPVFDSARKLLIADIENERIVGRQYEPFNPQPVFRLGDMLKGAGSGGADMRGDFPDPVNYYRSKWE
jgi:hypothetical protein